jgi:CPA2 family monovalent cation:H+ antiporter-2
LIETLDTTVKLVRDIGIMEPDFLKALVMVFGVSAISVFLLNRLRVPPVVGFIVAGVLIGPHASGIIKDVHAIEVLAEIGVILLLFTVGVEYSLKQLIRMRRAVTLGGGGQVILVSLVSTAVVYPYIQDLGTSIFIGFLTALSSTAIVMKTLLERGETDSPQGRMMTGILIFQDLCVVPFMLLVPTLAGDSLDLAGLGLTLIKTAVIITAVFLSAKWVVPVILHQVVHTRSRELFIITVILLCLGIALLTSEFGLSLALGAFLAGLIVSESEYAHQATAAILPLKDSFMGLFFVSVGMLIDVSYFLSNWLTVLALVLAVFVIKAATTAASVLITSATPRIALHAGIGIAQIGEFAFILAETGKRAGLMSGDTYQLFLSASVITMSVTPFLLMAAPGASTWVTSRKTLNRLTRIQKEERASKKLSDHVIIVGFGLNGRNLARTLSETGVPYAVLELNNSTVREERKKGEPIYFGDGTSGEIMRRLGLKRARILVIAISDPAATRKMVSIARGENPSIRVIVRSRYLAELDDLIALGATEVIPEEFETSIEIFSRVLHHYSIPRNVIEHHIGNIRKNSYNVLRTHDLPGKSLTERQDFLSGLETDTYLIKKQSPAGGSTLHDLRLRTRSGATLIAVKRGQEVFQNPSSDFLIRENDVILLVGNREDIDRAMQLMEP